MSWKVLLYASCENVWVWCSPIYITLISVRQGQRRTRNKNQEVPTRSCRSQGSWNTQVWMIQICCCKGFTSDAWQRDWLKSIEIVFLRCLLACFRYFMEVAGTASDASTASSPSPSRSPSRSPSQSASQTPVIRPRKRKTAEVHCWVAGQKHQMIYSLVAEMFGKITWTFFGIWGSNLHSFNSLYF